MQKRGVPPFPPRPRLRKRLPTTLSAAAAHARARTPGTPTPHRRAAPRQSPHPTPARKTPGPRRLRTQQHANHIEGHVRQPRLVEHGHRLDDVTTWCGRRLEQTAAVQKIPNSQEPRPRDGGSSERLCACWTGGSSDLGSLGSAALPPRAIVPRTSPSRSPYRAGTPGQLPPLCRLRRLLSRRWLATAKRPPLPGVLSSRRGGRTPALRMRTRRGKGREHGPRLLPPRRAARASTRSRRLKERGDDSGRNRGNPRPAQTANQGHRPRPPTCGARPESRSWLTGRGKLPGLGVLSLFHSALTARRCFL